MDEVNTALIEKYQLMYQEDPQSKIFATLAEAYRKMGMLEEAKNLCLEGLQHHPDFSGGRVALAKVLIDADDVPAAQKQLEIATQKDPENLLAQSLNAECLLRLKNPKGALRAFKMVLFLNPQNEKAKKAVHKLESLTADEYPDDVFAMKPLQELVAEREDLQLEELSDDKDAKAEKRQHLLERFLSLADAFIVRNDMERARESLVEAQNQLGDEKEIRQRLEMIHQRGQGEATATEIEFPVESRKALYREKKIEYLKSLLVKISQQRLTRG